MAAAVAIAPDLDILFDSHQTYSHSIGAAALAGLASALAAPWLLRRQEVRFRHRVALGLICACAYASHALLDWLARDSSEPIGLMIFWPFTDAFFKSGANLFLDVSRRYWRPQEFIWGNLRSVVREVLVLGPVAVAAWLVRIKTAAGLPSEVSGRHHPPKQRARPVLGIAQPVVQHVEDREADVEPDEVGERERPHRMVHAELHDRIDRFGRADAFHHREDRPR